VEDRLVAILLVLALADEDGLVIYETSALLTAGIHLHGLQ
jgi:hypothetical protein